MDFLREVQNDGEFSQQMTLFLLGDGEAGKTSLIRALKSPQNRSERIHEDSRTVGIDISVWKTPGGEVEFKVLDLAGQAVYGKTHQLFLQQRAIYLLVWQAHPALLEDPAMIHRRVAHWMDSLQLRVPGSRLMLVVTHIDAVSTDVLNELCRRVRSSVYDKLRLMAAAGRNEVRALEVHGEGESLRVNSVGGEGVAHLRDMLVKFAVSAPWYHESLPASWVKTKRSLLSMAKEGPFMTFEKFEAEARCCGVSDDMLPVAVKFLHETGVIRYFGAVAVSNPEISLPAFVQQRIRDDIEDLDDRTVTANSLSELLQGYNFDLPVEDVKQILDGHRNLYRKGLADVLIILIDGLLLGRFRAGVEQHSREVLQDTIFVSPEFMVNVMKGLIRHDRTSLLDYFTANSNRVMQRRVNRLSVWGRLHQDLMPFLWPCMQESEDYWKRVRLQSERDLWPDDVIHDKLDLDRAVALLQGFDLMVHRENEVEYLVPGLLKASRTQLTSDAFDCSYCPFYYKYSYASRLPPGAFEALVVRIARITSRIDCSAIAAVFYKRGHMGQLMCSSESAADSLDPSRVYLTVRSSSKRLLKQVALEVERMENFFPGLVRRHLEEELHEHFEDCDSSASLSSRVRSFCRQVNHEKPASEQGVHEAVQVLVTCDDEDFAEVLVQLLRESDLTGDLSVEVQLPSLGDVFSKDARVVIACITSTLERNIDSCKQVHEHARVGRSIIPVIAPGFEINNYSRWWPDCLPELERHKLFVDMRRPTIEKVSSELLPQIIKFLEEWQPLVLNGASAPQSTVDQLRSGADENDDVISCPLCIKLEVPGESNTFSRKMCQTLWNNYVDRKNSGTLESDSSTPEVPRLTCKACGTEHVVSNLLSSCTLPAHAPCPMCIKNGSFAPGSFNVRDCRLLLNEQDRKRVGMVTCPVCCASCRIMDVVPPEVFGSYNWGSKLPNGTYSTQEIVCPVLREVEAQTDLACWIDVEGGMGAGQDLMEEMLQGVSRANVVIIFLSDAYVCSQNCIREFLRASRACKYLIPVLVPHADLEAFPGISAGWTGNGADDPNWWQHAARICKYSKDPDDPGRDVDWSVLGLYQPVIMPANPSESILEIAEELARRIMLRFNRSERLDTNLRATQKRLSDLLLWKHLALHISGRLELGSTSNEKTGCISLEDPRAENAERVRQMFELFDIDASGFIDRRELRIVLRGLGLNPSDEEIRLVLDSMDVDGSQTIDFNEFEAVVAPRLNSLEMLERWTSAIFAYICPSGNAAFTSDDLKRALADIEREVGRAYSEENVSDMMKIANRKDDGRINQQELFDVMALTEIEAVAPLQTASIMRRGQMCSSSASVKTQDMIEKEGTKSIAVSQQELVEDAHFKEGVQHTALAIEEDRELLGRKLDLEIASRGSAHGQVSDPRMETTEIHNGVSGLRDNARHTRPAKPQEVAPGVQFSTCCSVS